MKMLNMVNDLKAMGMTQQDVTKQVVEQVLKEQYVKLMRDNNPHAGKEASDICNELISVIKRVYA